MGFCWSYYQEYPNPGDYFLFNIGNESIIIIKDFESKIHAHYNVCRHRGSHICLENEGNKKLLNMSLSCMEL